MNVSDEAHLFLTGYSINLIKSRDLVRNNHYLVTTNLGMLDKFISKHCTHYFLGTSYRNTYRRNTQMCIKIAENNFSRNCKFVLDKKYFNYVKSNNPNRKLIEKTSYYTWLGRFSSEIKIQSSTHFGCVNFLSNMNVKKVFLWGADYILDKPFDIHFYNNKINKNVKHEQSILKSYIYMKNKFNNIKFIHVCPTGYKSKIFEFINIE
jgi:hypothetical protein